MSSSKFRLVLRPIRNELIWLNKRLSFSSAGSGRKTVACFPLVKVRQEFRVGPNIAKVNNLSIAAKALNRVILQPGEGFSFWRIVGRPSRSAGFLPSRSLVGGLLRDEVGGGLCQIAGLIFHLSILSGLTVVERHAHSIDIYREDERHTPLGLDAAVSFPVKDLVIVNEHKDVHFSFQIEVTELDLTGLVLSSASIPPSGINIVRKEAGNGNREALVTVVDGSLFRQEFHSVYKTGIA